MEPAVLSVAQFLDAVNNALRQLDASSIVVEGEVSDARVAQGKWVSFDLKDGTEAAVLKCFATVWQLPGALENGMKVRVSGFPKIYERFGTFRLNVQHLELVGEGALRRAYEMLKKKLADEGLFDPARKRSIPRFPESVGLITSRDAAAYGDFLRVLGNRWGGVEILFAPVHVQGREAVPDILAAFAAFNAMPESERPEALVLVRGGGGLEDLHAFNDESVARAVFQSKIPVVVGVGHERDESLCDFVADIRASTPSNAAERLSPSREEIVFALRAMSQRMETRLDSELARRSREVDHAARAFGLSLERAKETLRDASRALETAVAARLGSLRERLAASSRFLAGVDPKRVLARGYALVTVGGKVLRDVAELDIGKEVAVQLAKGTLDAEVLRVNGKGKQKLV